MADPKTTPPPPNEQGYPPIAEGIARRPAPGDAGDGAEQGEQSPQQAEQVQQSADGREARVRDRAYALWESEGRPDGRERDHWEQAERETDPD